MAAPSQIEDSQALQLIITEFNLWPMPEVLWSYGGFGAQLERRVEHGQGPSPSFLKLPRVPSHLLLSLNSVEIERDLEILESQVETILNRMTLSTGCIFALTVYCTHV